MSTVHKSTPPNLNDQARLARGYPAITATVVNTPVLATTYAHWSSYTTDDFISENWEISQAIATTNRCLPDLRRRYVGDAGLDDHKLFAALSADEFVIRATHLERWVEIYNDHLDRWEREHLQDLVDTVPCTHILRVTFNHARKKWRAKVEVGWLILRLPDTQQRV